MEVATEIDWVAAWFDTWSIIDSTINFWITATFAVIVAIHALGKQVTKHVTRLVAALYATFSIHTASRMALISMESSSIANGLNQASINLFSHPSYVFWSSVSIITIVLTFLFGTIYTVYFVLTAPKRNGA